MSSNPAAATVAEQYLDAAMQKLFVVRRTLSDQADQPIRDYLAQVTAFAEQSFQPRDDLFSTIHDYTRERLGSGAAAAVVEDLHEAPVLLTANHHGVDFFAQSVQSSLLFGLREPPGRRARTVPVLACATIPLNNLTYPRGMLIYRAKPRGKSGLPLKLPVFPDRAKKEVVCRAPAIDRPLIERALTRASKLHRDGIVDSDIHEAVVTALEQDYACPAVLAQASYSDQAVLLNHRLWHRLFHSDTARPELVYLELERIAARLIERDVVDSNSLLTTLLFDQQRSEQLIEKLDGQRGCWTLRALDTGETAGGNGAGTMFFWGVDSKNRLVSMRLRDASLSPCSGDDQVPCIAWQRDAIAAALAAGTLVPSLFTSYLAVGIARGVTCLGGYYQADYLPAMQSAIAAVLADSGLDNVQAVRQVPTTAYLSGMQTVMTRIGDNIMTPAGALEMIAGGGLAPCNLEAISRLTVRQSHLASVVDTVLDLAPELARNQSWQSEVGSELNQTLKGRLVLMDERSAVTEAAAKSVAANSN